MEFRTIFYRSLLTLCLILGFASEVAAQSPPLWVEEVDGAPNGVATRLIFSNGTVTQTGSTEFTISVSGGGGTPGGSDSQVQYNNSGSFGGDADFVWNDVAKLLTIDGGLRIEDYTDCILAVDGDGDVGCATTADMNILSVYDSTGGMVVDNTDKVLAFDSEVIEDSNYAHTSGVITINTTGRYYIHVWASVEAVSGDGGTRGKPEITVQRDTGGGYSDIPGMLSRGYSREASSAESLHTSQIISLNSGDTIRVIITDIITDEPDQETVANGSGAVFMYLDNLGGGSGGGGGVSTDEVGTDELDDDANTPTAGDFVIVEAGGASFDYVTANAGTDVTADLEEEIHCSEHASSDLTCSGETLLLAGDSVEEAELADDAVQEEHLKAVDTPVDEDIVTYEATTGDFEYHTCAEITGSADLCDGGDADTLTNETITLSGDVTGSGTSAVVATVVDDSHNHVITNIDSFTEVELETQLSDVTNVIVISEIDTFAELNAIVSDETLVNTDDAQTLTNKTIVAANNSLTIPIDFIANASATASIEFNDNEQLLLESDEDTGTFMTVGLIDPNLSGDTVALKITTEDDNDNNYIPFQIWDDEDGTPDKLFQINYLGQFSTTGYDCTGNANGGALTSNGSGVITCTDDDVFTPTDLDTDYGNEVVTSEFDFGGGVLEIPNSTSLPGTCDVGDIYFDTDATSGQRIYGCESTNTWALQGDGVGSGSPGGADTQVQFNNSGSFGGSANLTWDDDTFQITANSATSEMLKIIEAASHTGKSIVVENSDGDILFQVQAGGQTAVQAEDSHASFNLTRVDNDSEAQNADIQGRIIFGSDGTTIDGISAFIEGRATENWATLDTPGKLVFLTTANGAFLPTQRFEADENEVTFFERIEIDDGSNTTCLWLSGDRIFHDTDCDGTKDAGEEFIDQSGGGGSSVYRKCVTVENLQAADDDFLFDSPEADITLTSAIAHCSGTCTTEADFTFEHVEIGTATVNSVTGTVDSEDLTTGDSATALSGSTSVTADDIIRFDVSNSPSPESDTYIICLNGTYD